MSKGLYHNKEMFSVVDAYDNVRFGVWGKEALHSGNQRHRGVHVFIETFGRGFILQLKSKNSENGGKWSSAVSGHVWHSETYRQAAMREAREELGLLMIKADLREILKITPCKETNNEFVTLFTYLLDREKEKIEPNIEEVESVMIAPLSDVIRNVKRDINEYSPAFVILFNRWLSFELMGGQNNVI